MEAVEEDLEVGVEAREVDLVGADDFTGGAVGFVEVKVAREVGVEALEDLFVEGSVDLPDGVEDLEVAGEGLLLPLVEELSPGLQTTLLLELGSV